MINMHRRLSHQPQIGLPPVHSSVIVSPRMPADGFRGPGGTYNQAVVNQQKQYLQVLQRRAEQLGIRSNSQSVSPDVRERIARLEMLARR